MEKTEDLYRKNYKIIQDTDMFCFGIDAVIIAHFADIKENKKVLEIGSGNGIIPLLLSARDKGSEIVGIEINKKNVQLANRNVELNKIKNIRILEMDIKEADEEFELASFDCVITNPPYTKAGVGKISKNENVAIARHEIMCTLEDIIKNASKLIKNKGEFYMINRVDRLDDFFKLANKYNIKPVVLKFVHSKINTDATLFMVKAVKNVKTELKIEKPLIIYDNDGAYTDEINEIYYK